jgi:RHS repeat-associated protein
LSYSPIKWPASWGKHYNYFRDYDPAIGRYLESDPLGIDAGINTFGYTAGNPLVLTDPLGLDSSDNAFVGFGQSLGAIGAFAVGLASNDSALVDVAIAELQCHREGNKELLIILASGGRGKAASGVGGPRIRIKQGSSGGPTAGKRFPKSVGDAARAEDPSATCVFCRRPGTGTEVDHAIAKSKGGNATLDNAQLSCRHCNASKGTGDFPKTPPSGYTGPWPPQ